MEFWTTFWALVLALGAGGFALLAVVVAWGGLRDLRGLLRDLDPGDDA